MAETPVELPRADDNRLLRGLPPDELTPLRNYGERLWLAAGTALADTGLPLTHACFPVGATIALMAHAGAMASLQVALIGDDGIYANPMTSGAPIAPLAARICTAGWVWRLDSLRFQHWLAGSEALRERLSRYLLVLLHQTAQVSVGTHHQGVEARLARWLLIVADRVHSRRFRLNHQAMAEMLGTHRSVISLAAARLRNDGLIHYSRGVVTVLEPERLEGVARGRGAPHRSAAADSGRTVADGATHH